ncbi:MAG: hypothetical protein JRN39_06870 [Nitrososphaerota archaeon]|nr:hypothetical protein [Nitrososphaerota archaeon]MDG6940105.1 hypothetical protein [Nitrososphaerota archaeon]
METLKVSRLFFYVGLVSAVVAVGYAAPVVLGPLVNPAGHNIINNGPGSILTDYTTWPAMWMVVAFTMFALAAVAGSFAWSFGYYLVARVFNRESTNGGLALLNLLLFVVGVYLSTALMAYVGYDEGLKIATGLSPLVVAGLAQWTVYPTGLGLGMALLGVLLGVLNLAVTARTGKVVQ